MSAGHPPPAGEEVIRVRDRYYILASSSLADGRTRVLKQGETFAVFDRSGDFQPVGRGHQGLYVDSTRHLHHLELRLGGHRPLLLCSTVTEDNAEMTADLTNPALELAAGLLEQDLLHVFRAFVVDEGGCWQQLGIRSYALEPVALSLELAFGADFADIFEVRGLRRKRRGELLAPRVEVDRVELAYRGLDDVTRRTVLRFRPAPASVDTGLARFELALPPGGTAVLELEIRCIADGAEVATATFAEVEERARRSVLGRRPACRVETANERFNDWINRSTADLAMMLTDTPHGLYPYAGVPWFNAPFGRDGIITALEVLWLDPGLASSVLRFLAATQAREEDPAADAEPGRILHEARGGEMARLGEVPFRRYYGTVDATPLFVVLARETFERTGDRELIESIWDAVRRALAWIDRYGDPDGDGFVEYRRRSAIGLVNQGWKDSGDSVFHADGSLARPPIALCEVQGYVYAARRGAAALARELGDAQLAREQEERARLLRARFDERFWIPELRTYALALDGAKRPCRVRSSNAAQVLFTGLARPERARAIAAGVLDPDFYSGWGVRTLSSAEIRYNPMSYHNGSIWPHDNGLIAWGASRCGARETALAILTGLFDATLFSDLSRLPELFCGFPRRRGEGPTPYPVACAPQAWSAGVVFLLLQSCLGLTVSGREGRVIFRNPALPPFLESLSILGLRVGEAELDLELVRHPSDVGIQVRRRHGDVEVVIVK